MIFKLILGFFFFFVTFKDFLFISQTWRDIIYILDAYPDNLSIYRNLVISLKIFFEYFTGRHFFLD
jgi:hypothetical protein